MKYLLLNSLILIIINILMKNFVFLKNIEFGKLAMEKVSQANIHHLEILFIVILKLPPL